MISGAIGPLAFCRLDRSLIERLKARDRLLWIMLEGAFWIAVGSAFYGAVLGGWRSGLQGTYAATKLPLLLLALVATTTASNAAFAKLVGTRLSIDQIFCASLTCLATLAIILASLAPISFLISISVERYGELLVGAGRPEIVDALRGAQRLLAFHVIVIGVSGLAAVHRFRTLLNQLLGSGGAARKLFWLCFAVQAFAGTQLSWILRPYLGKPNLAVEFFRPDAFSGSFLEEVARGIGAA